MSRKKRKRTGPIKIYQAHEFRDRMLEQYHSCNSYQFDLIESLEDQHPLVYIVFFSTGVNRVEVMYEVRDSDIFIYRVQAGQTKSGSGDLIGPQEFARISPEAENLCRENLFDPYLDIEQRLAAMFVLIELLGEVDLDKHME